MAWILRGAAKGHIRALAMGAGGDGGCQHAWLNQDLLGSRPYAPREQEPNNAERMTALYGTAKHAGILKTGCEAWQQLPETAAGMQLYRLTWGAFLCHLHGLLHSIHHCGTFVGCVACP
jgi:hypothetical protein